MKGLPAMIGTVGTAAPAAGIFNFHADRAPVTLCAYSACAQERDGDALSASASLGTAALPANIINRR